jgi:sec-independent protein translocase protein TatA
MREGCPCEFSIYFQSWFGGDDGRWKSATAEDSPMDGLSIWHWMVVVIVVLLFGRGKLSGLMADVAEGIKTFRKAMSQDDKRADTPTKPAETID